MFTGIIEEIGTVLAVRKGSRSSALDIEGRLIFGDLKLGDSVAVNGVCLTVRALATPRFTADVMAETLRKSTLGALGPGNRVNLERALPADGRFGGHIVSGHIDGRGTIAQIREEDNAKWFTIRAPKAILRYMVEKGSICVDGISLTIAGLGQDSFDVSIIPHTAKATTLAQKKVGDPVNLENDLIGKYVEKLFPGAASEQAKPERAEEREAAGLTEAFLAKAGF